MAKSRLHGEPRPGRDLLGRKGGLLGRVLGQGPWTPIESSADLAPSPDLILVASAEEIKTAEAMLDAIADASEQLRAFLAEKFKLEDVL